MMAAGIDEADDAAPARVLWVTSGYPWSGDSIGGIFFQTQAQALARQGATVTVVAPTPAVPWPLSRLRRRWQLHASAPRAGWDGGVQVLRPRYPNMPGQPSWARPDRFIAAAAWGQRRDWRGAAAIHGHYAVTGLAAWRLARRASLPFFLTFHGDDMNTWPADHPERAADLRAAVSEAAAVFGVSDALARRVTEVTGVDAVGLPLGVDHAWIDRTSIERVEARRRLGLPEGQLVVLFVGYLLQAKGVRELASAVAGLGDPFMGVFVGDGPERGYAADDAAGRLVYAGAQSHEDVIRSMSAADVLVLPSYGEGLPTVVVEAGSLGLPVIASRVGGIPELLEGGRGTLLPEVSAPAVAAALTSFRANREAATIAAAALREHVRARYDVDTNARELIAHYRRARGAR
jgi:teichuronic acid biosynthesis glycosyltransferase TuaC